MYKIVCMSADMENCIHSDRYGVDWYIARLLELITEGNANINRLLDMNGLDLAYILHCYDRMMMS